MTAELAELPAAPPGRHGWPWTEAPAPRPRAGSGSPRVTVVTPSFNQGRFLEETIRSVLLQDHPDVEYLVVDGASTDDSVAVIRRYAPWLAAWVSEPDRGQSDAVNKGWARATGDILAYLNSDDTYTPGAVARAVAHLEAHPELGVTYGAYAVVDESGAVIEACRTPSEWSPRHLMRGLPAHCMFFRREALARVGGFDVDLHFAMDADLCARLGLAGVRFGRAPGGPLVRVRHWPGAKSFGWSERGLREIWASWDRLAGSPATPAETRALVRAVKARAALWPAYRALEAGEARAAARYLRLGLAVDWRLARSGEFLRILLGVALGARGRALVRAARRAVAGPAGRA